MKETKTREGRLRSYIFGVTLNSLLLGSWLGDLIEGDLSWFGWIGAPVALLLLLSDRIRLMKELRL